jgi:peroxiredoxin
MKKTMRLMTALIGLAAAAGAFAIAPGAVVKNFQLTDQYGKAHELRDAADAKALVIMIHGNGCPIVRQAVPALKDIRSKYQSQGVAFLLLNSNQQDTREFIASEAKEFSMDFPILVDGERQHVGEALGVVRTSEVFVIDPRTWKLMFRGPIDDRLSYEKQRPAASHHYLADALDAIIAGQPVKVARADGVGCIVNFPGRAAQPHH